MKKRKGLFVSLVLSFTLLSSTFTVSSAYALNHYKEEVIAGELKRVGDEFFDKNQKFRKEFGLKSETEYITNLINESKTKSGGKYGVILTKEEEMELDARIESQRKKIPLVKEYISKNVPKENFAGIYIDQSREGIIKIGFKKISPEIERNIESVYANVYSVDTKVELYEAKYTESELDELHKKINDARENLKSKNIEIEYVVTDIIKQKVVIAVKNLSDSVIETLGNLFDKDMISIIQDTGPNKQANSSTYTRPVQGGLLINSRNGYCTAGFSARDTSTSSLYIITAGHCIQYAGEEWFQGGGLFAYANRWKTGGNADAAALKIDPSNATASIYAYHTLNFSKVSFVEQEFQETVGQTVCISGGYSDNTSCGTLESRNWSGNINGTGYHYNLRKASYSSQGGDSGSPIWAGFTLMGVHTASGGVYTHVQNAISALGVYPITTSP